MDLSKKRKEAEARLQRLIEEARATEEEMYKLRDKRRELTAAILETRGDVRTLVALEEEAKAEAKAGK